MQADATVRRRPGAVVAASVLLLVGCAGEGRMSSGPASEASAPSAPSGASAASRAPSPPAAGESVARSQGRATRTPARETPTARVQPAREPRRSYLTVLQLGLRSMPVVRYVGSPDDAEGTRIQNLGPTASPRGPRGGVGPGEVGNFIVTGHRTSHSAPFAELPGLGVGDRVSVRSGPAEYVYRITATRRTSFRSPRSLAEQSAAVPGRPGADPVRPMITLSTCATPEDHAAGNYWSDRFGNPEHRIDKVGVLVGVRG